MQLQSLQYAVSDPSGSFFTHTNFSSHLALYFLPLSYDAYHIGMVNDSFKSIVTEEVINNFKYLRHVTETLPTRCTVWLPEKYWEKRKERPALWAGDWRAGYLRVCNRYQTCAQRQFGCWNRANGKTFVSFVFNTCLKRSHCSMVNAFCIQLPINSFIENKMPEKWHNAKLNLWMPNELKNAKYEEFVIKNANLATLASSSVRPSTVWPCGQIVADFIVRQKAASVPGYHRDECILLSCDNYRTSKNARVSAALGRLVAGFFRSHRDCYLHFFFLLLLHTEFLVYGHSYTRCFSRLWL